MWQPRLWRAACGAGSTNHHAGDPISSILPSKTEHDIGLFGGLCGLTPRRRCQPSSGATRAEPVFPTKREGPARGRRRHAVVAEALVPPDAACVTTRATLAAQQCTQMPRNGTEGPFPPICVHSCVPTAARNSATAQQCTQTPQSGAERPDPPICVHYCDPKATHNPSPQSQQCTQMPRNGPEGPFPPICVHSCVVALAVRPTSPGW